MTTSLDSVQQDRYTLEFVKNQTPEIYLEAIKQNSMALCYVENKTLTICEEAKVHTKEKQV